MSFKEYLKSMLMDVFIITTFVNIAMYVLGSMYRGDVLLPYSAYLYPVIYGVIGTLPALVLYSKKELTLKQFIIRKIIHFLLLEVLLIAFTFAGSGMFTCENAEMIASFALSVLIIYVLVGVIEWIINRKNAIELMKDLKEYQAGCH